MQIIFIIALFVFLGLELLIADKILVRFFGALDEGGITTAATNTTRDAFLAVPTMFDYSSLFILVGLTIGLVITSFSIPTHPIFIGINFFGVFFLVFLAMSMSNMYGQMVASSDSPFLVEVEQFPITSFIINYMPYLCVLLVFISTVVMFAKGQSEVPGGAY